MAGWGLGMNLAGWYSTFDLLGNIGAQMEPGMQDACRHLQREIKGRAPVDTGHLRDSYEIRITRGSGGPVGHVGTDVSYGPAQEYGTTYQSGTPHVRPSLDANRDVLSEKILSGTFDNL